MKRSDPIPDFKAVEVMREARDKLSKELEGKTFEEIREYLDTSLSKTEIGRAFLEKANSQKRADKAA